MTKGLFPGSGTYRDVPEAMVAARKFREHDEKRFRTALGLLAQLKDGTPSSEQNLRFGVEAAWDALHVGKPIWMNAEITRMVYESSLAMPPIGSLLEFWRLPRRGFLLLGSPLHEQSYITGTVGSDLMESNELGVQITAFSWVMVDTQIDAALFILAWATDGSVMAALDEDPRFDDLDGLFAPVPLIPMSMSWYHKPEEPDGDTDGWPKFLCSLSAWMEQTLVTTPKHLDRAGARRAERADLPTEVGVTTFRRLKHHPPQSTSDREYSHRWVVSEHWRNQPCGPGNRDRRPVLIPPHVKGPLDKPLVVKNTVWANIR